MDTKGAGTGRFWLCPVCHRHVPGRTDKCQCGFDRTTVNVAIPEAATVTTEPPPRDARASGGTPWVVLAGFVLAFLGAVWLWRNGQENERANAELRARLAQQAADRDKAAPPPQIIVVPQRSGPPASPEPDASPMPVAHEPESPQTPAEPVPDGVPQDGAAARPRTEEQKARDLAVAVYRPYIERAAPLVVQWRAQRRRYLDACLTHTVTIKRGREAGSESTDGIGVGSSTGRAEVYGDSGRHLGSVTSQGESLSTWSETRNSSRNWSETTAVDNSTTPACRLIASDLSVLAPKIAALMDEADRQAVDAKVWTWLQTEVPNALTAELWRE